MILVTGGTGFLGSELLQQLASQGNPIRAIKRSNSIIPEILKKYSNIHWFDADVLDYLALEEAFNEVRQVYHCAGLVSFDPSNKKKMFKTNVQGTANIVNLCLDKKVKKLVHVSSVSTIGDGKLNKAAIEANHLEFSDIQTAYASSKHDGEMEVFRAIAEGLNAVIVNPSIIIGKGAGVNGSGALFTMIKNGLAYTDGSCALVAVVDVAKTMIMLMDGPFSGERYIISAENWTNRDLFAEIAHHLHLRPPSKLLKPWMLQITLFFNRLCTFLTGRPSKLSKDIVRNIFKKKKYSNLKIKQAIPIEFKSIKQEIAEICYDI